MTRGLRYFIAVKLIGRVNTLIGSDCRHATWNAWCAFIKEFAEEP